MLGGKIQQSEILKCKMASTSKEPGERRKGSPRMGTAGKSPTKRKRVGGIDKHNSSLRKMASSKLKAAINTSLNASTVHKQTLRDNNRQLAKTLENTRGDLKLAVEANIELKQENQQLIQQVNHFIHVAGLRDDQLEDEVDARFKERIRSVCRNLGKVTQNLTDTMEMLCETMQFLGAFDRKSSVGTRASSVSTGVAPAISPTASLDNRISGEIEVLPVMEHADESEAAGSLQAEDTLDNMLPLSASIQNTVSTIGGIAEQALDTHTNLGTIMEQSFLPEAAPDNVPQSRGRNRPGRCLRQIDVDSLMEFRAKKDPQLDSALEENDSDEENKENEEPEVENSESESAGHSKSVKPGTVKLLAKPERAGLRSSMPRTPLKDKPLLDDSSADLPSDIEFYDDSEDAVVDDIKALKEANKRCNGALSKDNEDDDDGTILYSVELLKQVNKTANSGPAICQPKTLPEDDDSTVLYDIKALKEANKRCNEAVSKNDDDDDCTMLYNVDVLKQLHKDKKEGKKPATESGVADSPSEATVVASSHNSKVDEPKQLESEICSPTGLSTISFYSSSKSATSPAAKPSKAEVKTPINIRRRTYTKRNSTCDILALQRKSNKDGKASRVSNEILVTAQKGEQERSDVQSVANQTFEILPTIELASPDEKARPRSIVVPFEAEQSIYEEADMDFTEVVNPLQLPILPPKNTNVLDTTGDVSLSELASFIAMGKAKREEVQMQKDNLKSNQNGTSHLPRPVKKVVKQQKQKRSKTRDKSSKWKEPPAEECVPAADDQDTLQDGRYYLGLLSEEKERISERIEQLTSDLNQVTAEELSGKLRTTIGQARLLTSRKFADFSELCEKNINQTTDKKTPVPPTAEDLAGFWDAMQFEINNINMLCDEISTMRKNGWKTKKGASVGNKEVDTSSATEDKKASNFAAFFRKPGTIKFTAKTNNADQPTKTKPGKSRSKTKSTLPKEPKKSRSKSRAEPAPPSTPTVFDFMGTPHRANLEADKAKSGDVLELQDISLSETIHINKPTLGQFRDRHKSQNGDMPPPAPKNLTAQMAEKVRVEEEAMYTDSPHGIMLALGNGKRTKPRARSKSKQVSISEMPVETHILTPDQTTISDVEPEEAVSVFAGATPPPPHSKKAKSRLTCSPPVENSQTLTVPESPTVLLERCDEQSPQKIELEKVELPVTPRRSLRLEPTGEKPEQPDEETGEESSQPTAASPKPKKNNNVESSLDKVRAKLEQIKNKTVSGEASKDPTKDSSTKRKADTASDKPLKTSRSENDSKKPDVRRASIKRKATNVESEDEAVTKSDEATVSRKESRRKSSKSQSHRKTVVIDKEEQETVQSTDLPQHGKESRPPKSSKLVSRRNTVECVKEASTSEKSVQKSPVKDMSRALRESTNIVHPEDNVKPEKPIDGADSRSSLAENNPPGRSRRAASVVSYAEPSLNKKMRRGDPVAATIYTDEKIEIYKRTSISDKGKKHSLK